MENPWQASLAADFRSADEIRESPVTEDPQERLERCGPKALSDAEVLSLLLGPAPGEELEPARELLRSIEGLAGLAHLDLLTLRQHELGAADRLRLLAAVELARRLARAQVPRRPIVSRPDEMAAYLALQYGSPHQEMMGALYLDARNGLIGGCELFRGTLRRACVEPRLIFREALLRGASGVLAFHTHPSGDPTPSAEDLLFTQRLAEIGRLMDINLVDHLILAGAQRWASMREHGAW